jgi:hypothetical protein
MSARLHNAVPVRKQLDQPAALSTPRRSHATPASDITPTRTKLTAATSKVADGYWVRFGRRSGGSVPADGNSSLRPSARHTQRRPAGAGRSIRDRAWGPVHHDHTWDSQPVFRC